MRLHNCTAGAGLVTATCVHWKDQANPGGLELPLLLIYIQIILSLENPVTVSGNPRNCLQALVTLAGGRKTSNGSFQMVFREVFIMASNNSHAFTLPII